MQWFLVLLRRKYSNLFLCRVNQLEKRFSVAQPSHSFFDSREPLLPPKRASFFQKWEKWHFLLEKVCHVVNPRYLCIWKRTREWPIPFSSSQSALSFDDVALARQSKQASSALENNVAPIRSRRHFAQRSLWLRFWRRRKAQGNAAAETRHKQEVFDIFVSR